MKKITINYKEFTINAQLSKDNTHIEDSYKVKKYSDMENILLRLQLCADNNDAVKNIKISTMIREWRAHNLLYALNIKRERTKDVDLNFNKWYTRAIYGILSCFYYG